MYMGPVWVDTDALLDQVDTDDLVRYLYNKKILSHQAVKKALGIEHISEAPSLSIDTQIDFDKLNLDTEDFLQAMFDDDIYEYLEDHGYDFPEPEEDEEYTDELYFDNTYFIDEIKSMFNQRFGKTWTKEELKKQISEAIDWFGQDPKG